MPDYTPPVNVTGGAKAKASHLNTQVLDNLRFLYDVPSLLVERAAALNLAHNTWAAIPFDTEIRDNAAMHSTSSNTERLIAPIGGVYELHARVGFAGSATGVCAIRATTSLGASFFLNRDGLVQATKVLPGSKELVLPAGGYVTVEAFQTSGATMALSVTDAAISAELRWRGPAD